jgi:membrane protease subunit HflC
MKTGCVMALVVAGLLGLILYSSAFVVSEPEQVVITQFGKTVGDPITSPGLYFKIPLVQTANRFDKRFLEWDGDPNQVPTKDKRFIWVDTYARWRIKDPLTFFQRLRDERGAQSRLDDILDGETRNAVAMHDLVEVIRCSTTRVPTVNEVGSDELDVEFAKITTGRAKIESQILIAAKKRMEQAGYGIELLDFRFKRINYVREVQRKIYERMISERKRIADKYRSEGQGEASKILGEKERKLKEIQSDAYRQAQEIRGKADAEAIAIYASAYDQSDESRKFYKFLKTMETYEKVFSGKDTIILSTDGEFLKYLDNPTGR